MKNYKGNMLLIELVIVILFFALSQVVIVQVFAETQRKSVGTARLNSSLVYAESILELLCNEERPEDALLQAGFVENGGFYAYTQSSGVGFTARVSRLHHHSGTLVSVELIAQYGEVTLFNLPSTQYFAEEVEYE